MTGLSLAQGNQTLTVGYVAVATGGGSADQGDDAACSAYAYRSRARSVGRGRASTGEQGWQAAAAENPMGTPILGLGSNPRA
jgi:hypothetical protein